MTDEVTVPGGRLAYEQHGVGAPLLLIRPLGGSMALWGAFRAQLAQHFRVISFDLRGSGQSSGRAAFGTRAIARDALALLDALALAHAHVFGISLGGMAATWLAIDAPTRVTKLVVACAPPLGLELTHASLRRELAMAACFLRTRDQVEPALVKRVLSHSFREAYPDEVMRIQRIVAEHPSTRASLLRLALSGLLHRPRPLGQVRAPTLVLAAARDGLLGTEPPRELAASIPGARFQVLPNSGHDLTLEQPLATARAVLDFLG
ncbi:MAG: alpha/beta fold hydrolase [Polyangiales bacterium]